MTPTGRGQVVMNQSIRGGSSVRRPLALTALPDQVLEQIVVYVYLQSALELNVARKKEHPGVVVCDIPARDRSHLCQVKYDVLWNHTSPPILTTLQSLGAVNKQFHGLCCPWLWRNIRFPSIMPASISLWTDDIFVRHGKLVKFISITLAEGQHQDCPRFHPDADCSVYDNLRLWCFDHERNVRRGVSLKSIEEIIMACPRTESVTVQFAPYHQTYTGSTSYNVLCKGFAAAISRAPLRRNLISLNLIDPMHRLSGRFVTHTIRELPDIVSLAFSGFKFIATDVREESLWWNLTQLEHLRELRLSHVNCQDGTWDTGSWLDRLQTLKIDSCIGLPPARLHELLSGFAPQLTRLDFEGYVSCYDRHSIPFILPALTRLDLRHAFRGCFIASFQECKDLKHSKHCCTGRYECGVLRELIALHIWPSLKLLDLRHPKGWMHEPGFETAQLYLAEGCGRAGIEVRLGEVDEEGL